MIDRFYSSCGDMGTEDLDALERTAQDQDDAERIRKMPGAARKVIDYWNRTYRDNDYLTVLEREEMDGLIEELAEIVGCLS